MAFEGGECGCVYMKHNSESRQQGGSRWRSQLYKPNIAKIPYIRIIIPQHLQYIFLKCPGAADESAPR